jgi:hypothetical protein
MVRIQLSPAESRLQTGPARRRAFCTVDFLVATYRPELTPPWPQRSHMTPITLNRLERPEGDIR